VTPIPPGDLGGHYAGIITRFGGFLIDVLFITTTFSIGAAVVEYVINVLGGEGIRLSQRPLIGTVAMVTWIFVYSVYCLASAGQTVGMAIAGVRVVRRDGQALDARRAAIRVLAFPLSYLLLGVGFVLIVLRRDRRALHDLIGGTVVVYAWRARARRVRFLTAPGQASLVASGPQPITTDSPPAAEQHSDQTGIRG
jgi:uncharacterized RDD family membrane protein YckC